MRRAGLVIAGGGFAGLRLAVELSLYPHVPEVLLIEREEEHQLITQLHLGAADAVPVASLSIPYRLPGKVRRLRQTIERIRPEEKIVETESGETAYEKLVISLGSEVSLPPIPGLGEQGHRLRWKRDAQQLRSHIERCFRRASREAAAVERRSWMRIVVAGGGYTGCQLAGELAHWLPELAGRFGLPLEDIDLILAESEKSLLPAGRASDPAKAARLLQRKGVCLKLGQPLRSVSADRVEIGDEGVRCRTLVWCGGIEGPALLRESSLPVERDGRCRVDSFLRPEGFPSLRIAGDCALVEVEGYQLPATAAQAIRQGAYLARSLAAEEAGAEAPPFQPQDTGLLVSLGGEDAVGDLLGYPLDGAAAGWTKAGLERFYSSTAQLPLPGLY